MPPTLSILTPVFNGERFLSASIASILGQRAVDLELIVIDDASTDRTPEIIGEWARRDGRVRGIALPENRGASFALNAGLDAARGEYIARQDADDVAMPERLARQAAVLDADAGVALVGTNYCVTDADGNMTLRVNRAEPPEVLAFLMHFENALGIGGTGMCRAAMLRELGGFSREFRLVNGYELWARLMRRGRVVVLPYDGLRYRVHPGCVTVTAHAEQKRVHTEICRRTISATLGREITLAEAEAVQARWWTSPVAGATDVADALIEEVYARMPGAQNRSRVIAASRFALSALSLARRRMFAEARGCVRVAARWHPWGYPGLAGSALRARIRTLAA
jgi:Glycosyl transferase family 2